MIPADWHTTHAPVVAGALRGVCALRSPATTQEPDPVTGLMATVASDPFWTGPCRVQELGSQSRRRVIVADDVEVAVDYLVVLPLDAPQVPTGTLIDLTVDPGDQLVAGLVLTAVHTEVGTERFEVDVFASASH